MHSNEIHCQHGHIVRRSGYSVAGVALVLILAACGNEAENTGETSAAPAAETTQNTAESTQAGDSATATAETDSATTGSEEASTVADAGEATQETAAGEAAGDAAQETAAKEEKQEREPMDGYTVYNRFCATCHRTGLNAAPKHRDKKAWESRIAKGKETLYKNSIEGFKGMPPKGGIAGLYDQEVKDAVDFMVEESGGWPDGE